MPAQIVSADYNSERDTFIIEVKSLDTPRLSASGETIQVAGTNGWAEQLAGVTGKDTDGNPVPLTAKVEIRYKNPYKAAAKTSKSGASALTTEDLKKAAAAGVTTKVIRETHGAKRAS
jgi:hypothetical protein